MEVPLIQRKGKMLWRSPLFADACRFFRKPQDGALLRGPGLRPFARSPGDFAAFCYQVLVTMSEYIRP